MRQSCKSTEENTAVCVFSQLLQPLHVQYIHPVIHASGAAAATSSSRLTSCALVATYEKRLGAAGCSLTRCVGREESRSTFFSDLRNVPCCHTAMGGPDIAKRAPLSPPPAPPSNRLQACPQNDSPTGHTFVQVCSGGDSEPESLLNDPVPCTLSQPVPMRPQTLLFTPHPSAPVQFCPPAQRRIL